MGNIRNVTKNASAAIHDLEMNEEEIELWLSIFKDMEKAQKRMCHLIMQDLKIESYYSKEEL